MHTHYFWIFSARIYIRQSICTPNLIKIRPLVCSLLLIFRDVQDLRKLHYMSHVSDPKEKGLYLNVLILQKLGSQTILFDLIENGFIDLGDIGVIIHHHDVLTGEHRLSYWSLFDHILQRLHGWFLVLIRPHFVVTGQHRCCLIAPNATTLYRDWLVFDPNTSRLCSYWLAQMLSNWS